MLTSIMLMQKTTKKFRNMITLTRKSLGYKSSPGNSEVPESLRGTLEHD